MDFSTKYLNCFNMGASPVKTDPGDASTTTTVATDKKPKTALDYDSELLILGEWGWYQKLNCSLLWITSTIGGIHVLMFSFTGLSDHNGFRCRIPGCDSPKGEFSFDDYNETDLFPKGKDGHPDYCRYYEPVKEGPNATCSRTIFTNESVACVKKDEFAYADFEFSETVATRFNLVCSEFNKIALVDSMYMVGLMIGSFICGYFSDKYGRKPAILACIIVSTLGSLTGSFMPEYYSYTAFRMITAVGAVGLFNESFTLTIELMGSRELVPWIPFLSYKSLLGNMIQVPYAIGEAILGLVAWALSPSIDYVTLQWTMSVAFVIQVPAWFIMSESPRWLISKGRTEKAKKVLEYAAKMNGKKLDLTDKIAFVSKDDDEETLRFTDLFKTAEMLKITIVMFICWPIVSVGYFGIGMSMTELGGNIFVSFILGALIEIPGYMLCMFIIDIWGRKPFFVWCLILTGASCIIAAFLPVGSFRTTFTLAGKMFAAGNFSVVYMYTAEIYPTVIRNTAIGVCNLTARMGGIAAPQIALYLPAVTFREFPMLLMGGFSMVGGFLALLLPETLGSNLPEKLEDVDEMRKNGKPFWKCFSPMANASNFDKALSR